MKTLAHARAYVLFVFMLLFLAGCATTEHHTESFIPMNEYEKTLTTFQNFRDELRTNGRALKEKRLTLEHYQMLQPNRDYLGAYFACLQPQKAKAYDSNEAPSNDPLPIKEWEDRPAVLIATGQGELWHMGGCANVGFDCIYQDQAPFVQTVICPIKFEAHHDQGPIGDLIGGRREYIRGTVAFLLFSFIEERNGTWRLLNMYKIREFKNEDLKTINAWYTRIGAPIAFAAGMGTSVILGH